ncbi:MAG TPA: ABC transporter permease, partial [Actinomycetota bacterium]|nr:ABC transporter permease [Actinomycetota bacterium]
MARFTLTRLASLVGILLGLSVVVFLLQAVVPADPVRAMVGASATPQIVEAKRHELGLDRPLPAQYAQFLSRAVRGDLQMSLHTRRPVRTDIAAFLPATLELAATALAMAVVLGGALGLLTARGGGTTVRVALVAGASVPAFLLVLLLLIVFYARLRWVPGSGRISSDLGAPTGPTGLLIIDGLVHGRLDVVRDALVHLALPALCLALGPAVALGPTLRSSLQTVLVSDPIRTARAKALTERGVLLRHGVRPALNAPLTMAGLQVGMLLAGVVVIESMFAWPGLGLYTARAITTVDFPAIAG